MDMSLKVVARPVVFRHQGALVRLRPGQTAPANHPYVKALPDNWKDFTPTYKTAEKPARRRRRKKPATPAASAKTQGKRAAKKGA